MKKTICFSLILVLLCVVAFAFAGCNMQDTIIVYTEAGFAPFEYISKGAIVGVDVDIMTLVGQKLGKKVVFETVGFDMIIPTVSAGKLCNVGAAGISVTAERQQKVDFSNEYYTAKLFVICKKDVANNYQTTTTDGVLGVYWESLIGKNIGVQGGTTADLFVKAELDEGGILYDTSTQKTSYDKFATAIADVGLNADVVIVDELPAKQLVAKNDNLCCAPLYYQGEVDTPAQDVYAICVTKGQEQLLDAINAVIAELGADGINQLINKHLGIEN